MVVLYSTGCPKCMVLEKKLEKKGIEYTAVEDVETINSMGYVSVPLLEVEGKVMEFVEANSWVNEQ